MVPLLIVSALLSAIVWHSLAKVFWIAVAGSTVTAVLLNWALWSSHIGVPFLDFSDWNSYFVQNISIVGAVSFIAAILVGGIKRWVVRNKKLSQ